MKSTIIMRTIANPRRTTLAHLQDTTELAPGPKPQVVTEQLPPRTANPQRTVLVDLEPALPRS
ncbi:hypothetical protein [Streptomyces sp. B6B3]|uniref:hypothetical protein n=1 Tax=Streptomyces sp. B6B3 TaxID=3153570 RepID=UPI00325D1558